MVLSARELGREAEAGNSPQLDRIDRFNELWGEGENLGVVWQRRGSIEMSMILKSSLLAKCS